MEKARRILRGIFFLPVWLLILLSLLSAFLLITTFVTGKTESVPAIIGYILSAYTLTAVCIRVPRVVRACIRFKNKNRYLLRYQGDVSLRLRVSLYVSLAVNLLYALLQMISGMQNRSVWYYALAEYYALLAVLRFFLLKDIRQNRRSREEEYRRYRFCGVFLLMIHLLLTVITAYIVYQNRGFSHGEIVTIAMAAYTFYSVTAAVINVLKYRRHETPTVLAAKSVSFSAALVSVLSLETAMLSAFGTAESPLFRRIITGVTGFAVCTVILASAIYMIVRGTRELRKIRKKMQ